MIAIFAALQTELAPLRKRIRVDRVCHHAACTVFEGKIGGVGVLLVKTGMGKACAEASTRYVLEQYAIRTLVSTGFAGALRPELRVGDILRCDTLACHTPSVPDADWTTLHCSRDAGLPSFSASTPMPSVGCVTSTRFYVDPARKAALGRRYDAAIVDMESYWIARIAREKEIPVYAVRVVSDRLHDRLLPFDALMTPQGRWRIGATLAHFARHPGDLAILARLAGTAPPASRALGRSILALLPALDTQGGG